MFLFNQHFVAVYCWLFVCLQ